MENVTLFRVPAEELADPLNLSDSPPSILTLLDETKNLINNNSKNSLVYIRYTRVIDFIDKYKVFYVSELKEMLNLDDLFISNRTLSVLLKALVFDGLLEMKSIKSGFHRRRQVYWVKEAEKEATQQITFYEEQLEQGEKKCDHGVTSSICLHCELERELGTQLTRAQVLEINYQRQSEKSRTQEFPIHI